MHKTLGDLEKGDYFTRANSRDRTVYVRETGESSFNGLFCRKTGDPRILYAFNPGTLVNLEKSSSPVTPTPGRQIKITSDQDALFSRITSDLKTLEAKFGDRDPEVREYLIKVLWKLATIHSDTEVENEELYNLRQKYKSMTLGEAPYDAHFFIVGQTPDDDFRLYTKPPETTVSRDGVVREDLIYVRPIGESTIFFLEPSAEILVLP